MWILYQQAKQWSKQPSEIIGIENGYVAYDFNLAVGIFGNQVEREIDRIELSEREQKQKNSSRLLERRRQRKLEQILSNYTRGITSLDELREAGVEVVDALPGAMNHGI